MPLSALDARHIATFLEAMAAESGAARNTLLAYGRDLRDAANGWLQGPRQRPGSGRARLIEGYLIALDTAGMSRATRARRLSALKRYFRFAVDEGWRADHPGAAHRRPRPRPAAARHAERGEVAACSTRRARMAPMRPAGHATPACSNCSTRPGCACPNWSACPMRRCAARPR
jgi:site-specific recombinase XerD